MLENYYALLQVCKYNAELRVNHKAKNHTCEPFANSSIRAIHFILTAAFSRAVKWEYLTVNQPALAQPPEFEQGMPDPPSPEELVPVINEGWRDLPWGMFLWLTMLSASRRGEMCVLRWTDIDWKRSVVMVERAGDQYDGQVEEITTKRKQQKRLGLDAYTMELLTMYHEYCERQCKRLGVKLARDAFLFSSQPDFSVALKPNTATQRYRRLAKRNGLRSTRLHPIRHYSATELLGPASTSARYRGASAIPRGQPRCGSTRPGSSRPTTQRRRSSPTRSPNPTSPPGLLVMRGRSSQRRSAPTSSQVNTRSTPTFHSPATWPPSTTSPSVP